MRQKEKTTDTVIRFDNKCDGQFNYRYELIMKEGDGVATWRIPLYSIRVHMTDQSGHSTSSDIKDVFADVGKAIIFYEKLVRNLATPIDLAYILEDEIST